MIRIVITDDHELIREGIKKIIRSSKDMRVVGEAASIADTLRLLEADLPDILVLDIGLSEHKGVEGLEEVRRYFPKLPVLILSMYSEDLFAIRAFKAGAVGYISKTMAAEELPKAIKMAVSGGSYISPRVAELLARNARAPEQVSPHESLTNRELQIFSMIGAGKQVKQIAAELSISVSSVNTYRTRIFRKMGLASNAALIRYAVERSLIK